MHKRARALGSSDCAVRSELRVIPPDDFIAALNTHTTSPWPRHACTRVLCTRISMNPRARPPNTRSRPKHGEICANVIIASSLTLPGTHTHTHIHNEFIIIASHSSCAKYVRKNRITIQFRAPFWPSQHQMIVIMVVA